MNKNAVIYARYSSQGQNEQSIEGQIRICTEYAESQGYTVVRVYTDKARSGTNDHRPAFQKMIKDAASGTFEIIIVYMFDRFARNRHDSILYKEMLRRDYGIRLFWQPSPSATTRAASSTKCFWNGTTKSIRNDFQNEYTTDLTQALKTERIAVVILFTAINSLTPTSAATKALYTALR